MQTFKNHLGIAYVVFMCIHESFTVVVNFNQENVHGNSVHATEHENIRWHTKNEQLNYSRHLDKENVRADDLNKKEKPESKPTDVPDEVPDYPFKNTSLTWDERVEDIVNRLTLDELVNMTYSGGDTHRPCPAVPRLGIGPFNFNTECLRGVANTNSTAFAQSIGLAASFSTEVLKLMASVTGYEARALYYTNKAHGILDDNKGIACFGPVTNLMRHPLWGRNQETYGEDPYLISILTKAYIRGLHGNDSRFLQASSGCKHLGLYSGPENLNGSRFSFAANVTERDLRLTYLPGFKACVEGGAPSIMCSYTAINGSPSCGNKRLLNDIMRKEYGFEGYYISDESAIENMYQGFHYVNSTLEAAILGASIPVNLELPPGWMAKAYPLLGQAVNQERLSFQQLVSMVKPMFKTRMRLGEFDPPDKNPYAHVPLDAVQSPEHRSLAVDIAMKTFILLKNRKQTLPLKNNPYNKVAFVGPMADNYEQLFGDYAATAIPKFGQTPYAGMKDLGDTTILAGGCDDNKCQHYDNATVIKAVVDSDIVFVCLGTGKQMEIEGTDRTTLDLPGSQLQLLKDVVTNAGEESKIILLVFSAGPVNISWAVSSTWVDAILQCSYPAQASGEALRSVVAANPTTKNYNSPAGRLPYTWYYSLDQVPQITNYSMNGRTYRYFEGEPVFPFGYGLSYTQFKYSNLSLSSKSVKAGDSVTVSVTVHNTGSYSADEVVQVYISWSDSKAEMPLRQLVAFDRVNIPQQSQKNVSLVVDSESMQVFSAERGFHYETGVIDIYVGGQQPLQKVTVDSNVLYTSFNISS